MAFLVGGDVWPSKRRKTNMTKSVSQTTVKDVFSEEFKKEIKLIPANAFKVVYDTQVINEKAQLFLFGVSVIFLASFGVLAL
jgi:hypothetical protein